MAGVKDESPEVRLRGWMTSGEQRFYGQILGTSALFAAMYDWSFARGGRFFQDSDVASHAFVAVIGTTVRDQTVRRRDEPGRPTVDDPRPGVYCRSASRDTADEDQIETVFVPYTALQDLLDINYLHSITVEAGAGRRRVAHRRRTSRRCCAVAMRRTSTPPCRAAAERRRRQPDAAGAGGGIGPPTISR